MKNKTPLIKIRGEMKRFANSRKPTVVVPPVVNPVQVEVALRAVPVEIRAVAVAIRVLLDRAIVRNIAHNTIPRILSGLNLIQSL